VDCFDEDLAEVLLRKETEALLDCVRREEIDSEFEIFDELVSDTGFETALSLSLSWFCSVLTFFLYWVS
jgi:hypothetical protein